MVPSVPIESASTTDWRTPDRADEGVDAKRSSNTDAEVAFHGYSRVTSTSLIETKILENEELIPINI